jgi:hypothetical protein
VFTVGLTLFSHYTEVKEESDNSKLPLELKGVRHMYYNHFDTTATF